TNDASQWILEKVVARVPDGFLAVGLVYPKTDSSSNNALEKTRAAASVLTPELEREGIILSGWTLIGTAMFDLVEEDFPRVLLPMFALLTFSLWLAFRRVSEVLLSMATLIFTGVVLLLVMSLAHWSWNLLNLMAVPLLLGAGVDYSIHMQLALRRHGGNIREVRRSIGRALWLCGGTTITGFGSLAFSNNAGLASLGKVCSAGVAISMLTSIYLLPIWWRTFAPKNLEPKKHT
ncbi:MAG: MMPL family transporter, partial [Verrucomicrobiota bacterium]